MRFGASPSYAKRLRSFFTFVKLSHVMAHRVRTIRGCFVWYKLRERTFYSTYCNTCDDRNAIQWNQTGWSRAHIYCRTLSTVPQDTRARTYDVTIHCAYVMLCLLKQFEFKFNYAIWPIQAIGVLTRNPKVYFIHFEQQYHAKLCISPYRIHIVIIIVIIIIISLSRAVCVWYYKSVFTSTYNVTNSVNIQCVG